MNATSGDGWERGALVVLVLIGIVLLVNVTRLASSYDATNVTVQVNITNTAPIVDSVGIDDAVDGALNVTLTEGSTRQVICYANVTDYNGHTDANYVNATFFHSTSSDGAANDNNDHYTNVSCNKTGNDGTSVGYWTCAMDIYYFANNGTWTCNITAKDQAGTTGFRSNTTVISPLFAINVTSLVDYGNLAVGDTSENQTLNITNWGNRNVNITVLGYARTQGDGLSMVCSTFGNLTITDQRFSATEQDFSAKQVLGSTAKWISSLTVSQQTVDGTPVTNVTYWQLTVPFGENPAGQCNGTLVVEATTN